MQNFIIFLLSIVCLILLILFKRNNNKLKKEKQKLLEDKNTIEKEIKNLTNEEKEKQINVSTLENKIELLNKDKETKQNDIEQINTIANNLKETYQTAYDQYYETLENKYQDAEKEHDELIAEMRAAYDNLQDILMLKVKNIQKDLDKISATRAAAMEAQLKEEEIHNKQAFYCPQIAENDLKDVKILRDIEYKLNNPRVLRMLIWQTYYQKSMNQVCANVLGNTTAEICGIYKITNQINNLVYIGQSSNISLRWKNHAKAGLGIDTPVGNKLYKAMQEQGLENFSFELLEECPRTELNEKENFYIKLYQSDQFGYNSVSAPKETE